MDGIAVEHSIDTQFLLLIGADSIISTSDCSDAIKKDYRAVRDLLNLFFDVNFTDEGHISIEKKTFVSAETSIAAFSRHAGIRYVPKQLPVEYLFSNVLKGIGKTYPGCYPILTEIQNSLRDSNVIVTPGTDEKCQFKDGSIRNGNEFAVFVNEKITTL